MTLVGLPHLVLRLQVLLCLVLALMSADRVRLYGSSAAEAFSRGEAFAFTSAEAFSKHGAFAFNFASSSAET